MPRATQMRLSSRANSPRLTVVVGRQKAVAITPLLARKKGRGICWSIMLFFLFAGSLLAIWGVRLLVQLLGSGTTLSLAPDWRVLAFTIVVSLLTGIVFGFVPALQTLKVRVAPALKNAARSTPEAGSRFSWGKGLIAAQVALSLLSCSPRDCWYAACKN